MDSLDWNDLRYVLAVARSGSAASAARTLGVSHATVLRRIQALEQALGVALFDRLPSGYLPTEAGRRFVEVGTAFDHALTDTQRMIDGQTTDLAGTIRFTTTDSLAHYLAPEILASFHARYPAITVELLITNSRLDLDKRDADVTLRPTGQPPESWVGMRLARLDFGVYAAPSYLAAHPDTPWPQLHWLAPGGPPAQGVLAQWLNSQLADARIIATADSFTALCNLARTGMGATILPRFLGQTADLQLLHALPQSQSPDIWLLTHPHLRHAGRIHVFLEHVAEAVRSRRSALEGGQSDAA